MAINPYMARPPAPAGPQGLADVLERVLDKGLVIAGDIQVNLLDIELITIKIRLLVASADTAQQMGIDWWKHDEFLTKAKEQGLKARESDDGDDDGGDRQELLDRLDRLEDLVRRQLEAGEQ